MRILASNPDTIGDFVLRQPLYRALTEAGHELMLAVRPLVATLAPAVAPGARVVWIERYPYESGLSSEDAVGDREKAAVLEFDPDVLLVAPFQWTVHEERLSALLPRASCVALCGGLTEDPDYGPPPESTLRPGPRVAADVSTPESAKNSRLASEILGRAVTLPDPKLEAAPEWLAAGDAELARLGVEAGSYWVACVGHNRWTAIRNWRPERWAEALGQIAGKRRHRFVFLGNAEEADVSRDIRRKMGSAGDGCAEWFGEGEGALDTLLGLIARSAGYVGRDTGPMHLAAALSRPVLAVFGGGTWPRFLPQTDASVSLTVGVPCAGCGWKCCMSDSHCVKDVPVAEVVKAAARLEKGEQKEREARVLKAGEVLLSRIGREGAAAARSRLTQLSMTRRDAARKEQDVNEARQALERALATGLEKVAREVSEAASRASRAEAAAEQMRAEVARARTEGAGEAVAKAAAAREEAQHLMAEINKARVREGELQGAIVKRDTMIAEKAKELESAKAELSGLRQQLASHVESVKRAEAATASAEKRADEQKRAAEVAQAALADGLKSRDQAHAQALRVKEAEFRAGEAELRNKLSHLRTECTRAEGERNDVKMRLERAEADRAALDALARQQLQEVRVVRERLNELMASRWRKVGQRLGIAMTMPWEREFQNGQH